MQEEKTEEQKSTSKLVFFFVQRKKSPNPRIRTQKMNLIAGPLGYFLFLYFLLNYSLASFQKVLFLFFSDKSKYLTRKGR